MDAAEIEAECFFGLLTIRRAGHYDTFVAARGGNVEPVWCGLTIGRAAAFLCLYSGPDGCWDAAAAGSSSPGSGARL